MLWIAKQLDAMRYLITGGAGFIGHALSNRLVRDGHTVYVIDNQSSGDRSRLDSQVIFTHGDINDVPAMWSLLQNVDCVFHLAARVSVPQSVLYPRTYAEVNVLGTASVMEAMRDAGVKRVVHASSGAVYGEQSMGRVTESMTPRPDSPYAVSKLAAEYYVRNLGNVWGLESVILRIFNTYGPGQPLPASHWPVVSRFLSQAIKGGSLVIFGDGEQIRDYVYIDDVVEALIAASQAPDADQLTINIGSGTGTSVKELASLVGKATNKEPHVLMNPRESGGVSQLTADISLASKVLNYHPSMTLLDGLSATISRDPRFQ
ncbi:MAG: NAD-dependent epimerase/dehydratase family protein [Chloroflexota bacterium]